jgi:predicted MFS family arabinose efflux permease
MLVIARTVQGAFGALLAPSVLAILTTTFTDPDERGKAFGIYGAVAGAGGALGLLLGGLLTSYASWRWTLFINLAFAFGAIAGTLLWFENDQGADNDPFDLPGLLLVGVGLFSLVFGFSHAETTAWSDPFTVAFLVAGVVALSVFAVFETKAKFPLLPPRVVLNRTRGGSLLVSLLGSVGVFGVFLFLTYYLQATLAFSPVKTGILFLPLIGAVVATAQVSNRVLLPRFGPKPVIPVGLLLSAGALFGLHLVGLHTSYLSHVFPYLLVLGVGSGLSISMAFSTGTLGLAPQDAGVGSATLNTAQMVGGSIGTALLNTLAASATASYLVGRALDPANVQAAQLHGYTTIFVWCALVFAVAALIAALVLPPGNLKALLAPEDQIASVEPGSGGAARVQLCRIRIACR